MRPAERTGPLRLGAFPTPVERLPLPSPSAGELWIKRDDLAHAGYGGNKVRKLEHLLAEAKHRGATRIVTFGAAGSHQVLATAFFARAAGLEVDAVLFPQPYTPHAAEVLRASLGLGVTAHAVQAMALVPFAVGWTARARWGRGAHRTYVMPPGGSSVEGALGYVQAARELATQIRGGVLPEPDVCVLPLGSGGTAAGLAAGFAAEGLGTRVVGVIVLRPAWAARAAAARLARACGRRLGIGHAPRLACDGRFVGRGYGFETDDGRAAQSWAAAHGLVLDPTYTAKAFACALWYARSRAASRILYWHTLSSAPMAPLLERAAAEEALPPELRALLRRGR